MLEKNQMFVVPTFGYRNKPEGENLEKFNEDLKKLEIFENQGQLTPSSSKGLVASQ